MLGRKYTILAPIALVAAFGLAACEGDTGPQGAQGNPGIDGIDGTDGQDGLGYVPVPASDQTLGEYDPVGDPVDQLVENQLISGTGVWELQLDGGVQLDLGDGAPPVFGDAVRWDADHDELWVEVDGEWVAITEGVSIGCTAGVPQACVEISVLGGDYAQLAFGFVEHGPATETYSFAHYGVKTAAADMPTTGTASYSGSFFGYVSYTSDVTDGFDELTGGVGIDVDFGTGEVGFASSGGGSDGPYSLTGAATIDGNSYSGTVEGTYDDSASSQIPTATFVTTESSLSGSFYGPVETGASGDGPFETLGVVEANTDPADLFPATLVGGFGASLD